MKKVFAIGLILVVVVLVVLVAMVAAHEEREVGDYALELGWRVEPAYTDLFNGPEIFIEKKASGEPVTGADDTLKLEVSFGADTKELKLREVYNDPGHYTADLIPTRPGDYTFHLTGKIGDLDVDETFTSADGKFGTVEPISDIRFP